MPEEKEEPKEKKEGWLNYLALTTVIFAVAATLSTFRGGGYANRSVLSQSKASDQWAYYQAKSIKGYLYELQREKLALDLKALPKKSPLAGEYAEKIKGYEEKIKKYESEKEEISKAARELEAERDISQKHSKTFGMAVIFLQIAILLSSISALMKKKPVWLIGAAAGAVGLVHFINGFLLFLK